MLTFRKLNRIEEKEMRQLARNDYKPFSKMSESWHPVYRNECARINRQRHLDIQKKIKRMRTRK